MGAGPLYARRDRAAVVGGLVKRGLTRVEAWEWVLKTGDDVATIVTWKKGGWTPDEAAAVYVGVGSDREKARRWAAATHSKQVAVTYAEAGLSPAEVPPVPDDAFEDSVRTVRAVKEPEREDFRRQWVAAHKDGIVV